MVDVGDGGAVDEVDGAGGGVDAGDGGVFEDVGVLEGDVAEVGVEGVPEDDGVDEVVFGDVVAGEVKGNVGA